MDIVCLRDSLHIPNLYRLSTHPRLDSSREFPTRASSTAAATHHHGILHDTPPCFGLAAIHHPHRVQLDGWRCHDHHALGYHLARISCFCHVRSSAYHPSYKGERGKSVVARTKSR